MSKKDHSDFREEIERLKAENDKLKLIIRQGFSNTNNGFSDEEAICVVQLKILRELSQIRDLSLDEVKKFDLLVKNLKSIRGNVVQVQPINTAIELSTTELLSMVENDKESQ